jgi:hypothetical protein
MCDHQTLQLGTLPEEIASYEYLVFGCRHIRLGLSPLVPCLAIQGT